MKETDANPIPFLKWAGGKRWLVKNYPELFPAEFNYYIEPFLGGGSVYFYLRPVKAIVADLNEDLINTYQSIKDDWGIVYNHLKNHHKKHNKHYYYQLRDQKKVDNYEQAARFIYLNRTCWNGLYRVNLKGKFNVPIGTKLKVLLPTDSFDIISTQLHNTQIICSDFERVVDMAKKGDLIFADPPYTIQHNINGFLKYNEKLFHWEDQIRLRDSLLKAKGRGVKIILTNADHSSIKKLYKDNFELIRLERISKIAANAQYRNSCSELIIRSI